MSLICEVYSVSINALKFYSTFLKSESSGEWVLHVECEVCLHDAGPEVVVALGQRAPDAGSLAHKDLHNRSVKQQQMSRHKLRYDPHIIHTYPMQCSRASREQGKG